MALNVCLPSLFRIGLIDQGFIGTHTQIRDVTNESLFISIQSDKDFNIN